MWKKVFIANGKGTYEETALFDTGADVSLVDSEVVKRAGLRFLGRTISLRGISGRLIRAFEFKANIFVPEVGHWRKQSVYVPETPVRVDGRVIIGKDYMRATGIELSRKGETQKQNPLLMLLPLVFLAGLFLGSFFGSRSK